MVTTFMSSSVDAQSQSHAFASSSPTTHGRSATVQPALLVVSFAAISTAVLLMNEQSIGVESRSLSLKFRTSWHWKVSSTFRLNMSVGASNLIMTSTPGLKVASRTWGGVLTEHFVGASVGRGVGAGEGAGVTRGLQRPPSS